MNHAPQSEAEPQKCLSCGALVALDSPERLCPVCLLAHVINGGTEEPLAFSPNGECLYGMTQFSGIRIWQAAVRLDSTKNISELIQ